MNNTSVKEIQGRIREVRREMKAAGIKRVSCFNGGLDGQSYHFNRTIFELETQLIDAKKRDQLPTRA